MKLTILLIVIMSMVIAIECVENSKLELAEDFALLQIIGKVRICNFIICREPEAHNVMRKLSSKFQCFLTVHDPKEDLSDWYMLNHQQLFILDSSCRNFTNVLVDAEKLELFKGDYMWLILIPLNDNNQQDNDTIQSITDREKLVTIFENINISIRSQIYVATQTGLTKFELTGLYKRNPGDLPIKEILGDWSLDNGINFKAIISPPARRLNMQGRLFTAGMAINDDDSLNHLEDLVDSHIDNLSKINYVFTNLVIYGLNASVKYHISKSWGEPNENGTFNGMIGTIQRGEAEIAVSPLIMTLPRMRVLEYLARTFRTRIKFIFLSPPLSYKNNIYILPFSSDIWYSCIALLVTSVLFLYLTSLYENGYELKLIGGKLKKEKIRESGTDETKQSEMTRLPNSWIEVIMTNFGALCQQDTVVEPKGAAGRIVILHVKIAILFLYVSYSAAIVVLLQSSDTSITTLSHLAKSDMKIGAHEITYNHYYFNAAPDPIRKEIAQRVDPVKGYLTPEEGVNKVRSGLFAFYIERTPGYYTVQRLFNEDEKCRLQELHESFIPDQDPLVALQRNNPYSKILKMMFRRINEFGLINREVMRRNVKKPNCRENTQTYVTVGLIDCKEALVLFLCGQFISIIILGMEFLYFKRKSSIKQEVEFLN